MKKYIDLGGIIAGAAATVLGIASMAGAFSSRIAADAYNHLLSYSFGGDFYTEIYKASYEINDSLADLSDAVANSANAITGAVSAGCGIIAIAVGLFMIFRFASSYMATVEAEKRSAAATEPQADTAISSAGQTAPEALADSQPEIPTSAQETVEGAPVTEEATDGASTIPAKPEEASADSEE